MIHRLARAKSATQDLHGDDCQSPISGQHLNQADAGQIDHGVAATASDSHTRLPRLNTCSTMTAIAIWMSVAHKTNSRRTS